MPSTSSLAWLTATALLILPFVSGYGDDHLRCTETTVAILGGGMAGIAAAQALTNASIDDFFILEYRDQLGGRVWHTPFGKDPHGKPYTVELGANWLQGIGSKTTVASSLGENPVWTLAQKHNLTNAYSNYSSIRTYNETGHTDYRHLLDEYNAVYAIASRNAGHLLTHNLQDQTARSGLALAGWRPRKDDMKAQAVEWWNWDWESASTPETSSFIFGITGENLTFNQFGPYNHFVSDPRGYSALISNEAAALFPSGLYDHRIWLDTEVADIQHSSSGVTIRTANGDCLRAAYAICTFSLGVLQNASPKTSSSSTTVRFSPPLPEWKTTAIHKFSMGTYTKIFMQFRERFWPANTQFLLYADPLRRGYYPVFQSLSEPSFLSDSNILFVTVVGDEAERVERQSNNQTKAEILAVLRKMFPDQEVGEPIAFAYPRWTSEPWARGSYSNWPAGTTLEMHQNLRANVGRVWFAGEATSAAYFGFLHGAWFEGREAGEHVARLVRSTACGQEEDGCGERVRYEVLHGTTPLDAYSAENGWPLSSTEL